MWIFAKTGFVAIAKFNPARKGAEEMLSRTGHAGASWAGADPNLWLVRARRREHLEEFLGDKYAYLPVVKLEDADYQYRALVDDLQLVRCMTKAAMGINYDSLKAAVKAEENLEYYYLLNRVWWDVLEDIDERPTAIWNNVGTDDDWGVLTDD